MQKISADKALSILHHIGGQYGKEITESGVHIIYRTDWCDFFWNYFNYDYRHTGINYTVMAVSHEEWFTIYFGKGEICFILFPSKPVRYGDLSHV